MYGSPTYRCAVSARRRRDECRPPFFQGSRTDESDRRRPPSCIRDAHRTPRSNRIVRVRFSNAREFPIFTISRQRRQHTGYRVAIVIISNNTPSRRDYVTPYGSSSAFNATTDVSPPPPETIVKLKLVRAYRLQTEPWELEHCRVEHARNVIRTNGRKRFWTRSRRRRDGSDSCAVVFLELRTGAPML
jgi:hypothetical protein